MAFPSEGRLSFVGTSAPPHRNGGSIYSGVPKLAQSAEKRWRKLKGYELLGEVITGVIFKDGIRVSDQSDRSAA